MLTQEQKLNRIIRLSLELAEINDLDLLLERILGCARGFANAEAGSIYVVEDGQLRFSRWQNEKLQARAGAGQELPFESRAIPLSRDTIAGYTALTGQSLNIPDVYGLPAGVPYRFSPQYDRASHYRTGSMLSLPLQTSRGKTLGVLQVINARDASGAVRAFSDDDETLIRYFGNTAAMALERAQMTRALILRMISMAELRDPKETGAHVNRVASFAAAIFEQWAGINGMPLEHLERRRDVLRMAAMLHDVGKVAISDTILKKPGRLTPAEYETMKQHTYLGARLFLDGDNEFDAAAAEVALRHHENWDGTGYPGHVDVMTGHPLPGYGAPDGNAVGLKGTAIPLFGRIVKVADVYDALRSKRVYKDAMPEDQVLTIMRRDSGTAFDPEMVQALFATLGRIHEIQERYEG